MSLLIRLRHESVNDDSLSPELHLAIESGGLSKIISNVFAKGTSRLRTKVVVVITQTTILAAMAGERCLVGCGVRFRRDAR